MQSLLANNGCSSGKILYKIIRLSIIYNKDMNLAGTTIPIICLSAVRNSLHIITIAIISMELCLKVLQKSTSALLSSPAMRNFYMLLQCTGQRIRYQRVNDQDVDRSITND